MSWNLILTQTWCTYFGGNTRPGIDPSRGPITQPTRPYPRNGHIITRKCSHVKSSPNALGQEWKEIKEHRWHMGGYGMHKINEIPLPTTITLIRLLLCGLHNKNLECRR